MSVFSKKYTIDIDKSINESKALFEKYFQDMAKKGYSSSTVIYHSDYGRKKFTGTIESDGTYKARLIVSQETDSFYRSAPVNTIAFSGDDSRTRLTVSVQTVKYGILFFCIIALAVMLLCISLVFINEISVFIPFVVTAVIILLLSIIPLLIASHRISEAKETLIYILKYSDK